VNPDRRRLGFAAGAVVASLALPACANRKSIAGLTPLTAASFSRAAQRGVGMGLLRFGERSQADLDALLDVGAGHVRMFIELEPLPSGTAFAWPTAQIDSLLRNAAELQARGLYMVPTVLAPTKETDKIWATPSLENSLVEFWAALATRLRGQNVFAAFDLVNEPVPPGFTYGHRQERWLDLAARMVEAVQKADATRVCIIESAPNSIPQSFDNLRPLPYPCLVYSFHSYMPMSFTHQGVIPEYMTPKLYSEPLPGGNTSASELANSLAEVIAFTLRYELPVYVGEFSAPRWAPGQSAAAYVADSIAHFERHGWSWAYHEFRAWHGWDAEMASASREPGVRTAKAPVRRVLQSGLLRRAPGG